MKTIISVFFTFSLILGAFLSKAQDTNSAIIDQIIAVVGDEVILKSDIERQLIELHVLDNMSKEEARCELFKATLYQKLLVNQANIDSVEVSEDDVISEIDRRMNYFISQFGSAAKMEMYYGKTIAEIKEEMHDPIKELKLANAMKNKVLSSFEISPSEVKKFLHELPADSLPFYNTEVEVAQLVINPKPTDSEKKNAREKLEDIRRKIINGSSFETMAILYSDDPGSATRGGDLGLQSTNAFVPEFAAACTRLKKDSISNIIETKYGYHILKLVDRKGEKVQVKHILIIPKITPKSVQIAKEKLLDIRDRILHDTLTFQQAAMLYSDDENTKNSGGNIVDPQTATSKISVDKIGDVDPSIFFIVDTMQTGSITVPVELTNIDGTTSYRIIFLKNKTLPHKANLNDDYPKIKELAESYYQQEILNTWIDKTVNQTYITIKEPYLSCKSIEDILQNKK